MNRKEAWLWLILVKSLIYFLTDIPTVHSFKLSDLPALKRYEIPLHYHPATRIGRKFKDISKDAEKSTHWDLKSEVTARNWDLDEDPSRNQFDLNYHEFLDLLLSLKQLEHNAAEDINSTAKDIVRNSNVSLTEPRSRSHGRKRERKRSYNRHKTSHVRRKISKSDKSSNKISETVYSIAQNNTTQDTNSLKDIARQNSVLLKQRRRSKSRKRRRKLSSYKIQNMSNKRSSYAKHKIPKEHLDKKYINITQNNVTRDVNFSKEAFVKRGIVMSRRGGIKRDRKNSYHKKQNKSKKKLIHTRRRITKSRRRSRGSLHAFKQYRNREKTIRNGEKHLIVNPNFDDMLVKNLILNRLQGRRTAP